MAVSDPQRRAEIERPGRDQGVARTDDPHARRDDLQHLQHTAGNRATARLLRRAPSGPDVVRREVDAGKLDMAKSSAALEGHIGGRARQQQLVSGDKAGQGMAEQIVRGGGQPNVRSLVDFVRFDDSAKVSVLETAENGGLSDAQKWDVIKVNTEFMRFIVPGMSINKIVPDATVRSILKTGAMSSYGNSVGGSVAHAQNYEGLSGEEAVSNFGLDYGGYNDVDAQGQKVRLAGGQATTDMSQAKASSYVKSVGEDPTTGKEKLAGVKNVFFLNLKLEAQTMPNVKVPIHQNIIDFASRQRASLRATLADPSGITAMAEEMGGTPDEVRTHIDKKLEILDKFLSIAMFSAQMAVSTKLSGKKNEDDPLTNLGITKPGARLENQFGTINQEYHLTTFLPVPEGTGLFLKDRTGKDSKVAGFQMVAGALAWTDVVELPIVFALRENDQFRKS